MTHTSLARGHSPGQPYGLVPLDGGVPSTFHTRVDPELVGGLAYSNALPPPTTVEELVRFRSRAAELVPPFDESATSVILRKHDGPVPLWSYTPPGEGPFPAIYWIHGGGMISGSLPADQPYCTALAEATGCVVIAVDYRLAPEYPHPVPVEDSYAGLEWAVAHAAELRIDPRRLAVGGSSAGGGIAASVALAARDRGGPALAFQYLMYPMLDDTQTSPSSREFSGIPTWSRERNAFAWDCLLGSSDGSATGSPYAAPARALDLAGLPPAMIQVGELDLFRDEDVEYALRLLQGGVPTELHLYPGAYHGFELVAPDASVSRQALSDRNRALIRALHEQS
ncbi:alpha/beta hydrolase [Arthrobacter tumbae]|uniref:alpha/beta hydrolase n=1 Tax=Arthrobacter tumbae TaxID=163874 RepID=UPI001958E7AA|nr:alpha/beta hydrolase [Arthrobacter tumbae]MBM7780806.1 acetyl esterase/lipase [Arthrobacter tumbae]